MLLLQAQAAGGATSFFASPIFMLILMFVIMWFFMIRPQRKQQKEIEAFRNSLAAGQQVVTSGGIYGTVREIISENGRSIVVLEIAHGVKIKIDKSSVFADMSVNAAQQK
ncbi:MAG: preprotein translocase subunit YajC [Bacteroidaceae bacterium]|nr:preprotein translocase subunit YajC [Bacteroidaceae bacterium]